MADTEKENILGFVDKRRTQNTDSTAMGNVANYASVVQLRTRLGSASPYYTAARLNTMTKNDMVYALRSVDDAAGI